MATRTISNTGGNYNATASWVEGIVPTSADDVVATATSGNLTINVASAAGTVNLTNYVGTITMNANWTVSGASGVNIISVTGMTWNAGTGGIFIFSGTGQSIGATGTVRIPHLRLNSNTKTITSNLYCVNFDSVTQTINFNGLFTIFVSGNLGVDTGSNIASPFATSPGSIGGTTKIVADGSGNIFYQTSGSLSITGSYSTPYDKGLSLVTGASVSITGTISNAFTMFLATQAAGVDTYTINSNKKINTLVIVNQACNALQKNATITLQNDLILDNLIVGALGRVYTSDNTNKTFNFSGSSLSASNVALIPFFRSGSSTTSPVYTYLAPDIQLQSGLTHSFGNISAIGGLGVNYGVGRNALISSNTPGTKANINLLSKTASQIINYSFQDINASGEQIVAINGTFSNTTNITNTYPTAGSGGGGSWTFVN